MKTSDKNRILIIIPCFNEEKNIEKTVDAIRNDYDYIVVNDSSTDNSWGVIKKRGYHAINLINNLGIGGAMQTGYKYAYKNGYDIAVQFDGDGQHSASEINKLIRPLVRHEADLVIGSRFVGNTAGFKSSSIRRKGIALLSFLMRAFSGCKVYDMTSGFRAANTDLICAFSDFYPYEYPEPITNFVVAKKGFNIVEIPTVMKEREGGASSIGGIKSAYYMVNTIINIFIIELFGLR